MLKKKLETGNLDGDDKNMIKENESDAIDEAFKELKDAIDNLRRSSDKENPSGKGNFQYQNKI